MLLVFPFVAIVGMKNLPQILDKQPQINNSYNQPEAGNTSFPDTAREPLPRDNRNIEITYGTSNDTTGYQMEYEGENQGSPADNFPVFLRSLLVSFALGLIFNYPFKRYFRLKRKRKAIPKKLFQFVKKWLLKVPLTNGLIFLGGLLFALGYSIFQLNSNVFPDEVSRNLFKTYLAVSAIASLLAFMLIYFWERNRVHLKYLEHVFSREELKKRIFKVKKGKIQNKLLVSNFMTSLLPLTIVMFYLFLSVTQIKELDIKPEETEKIEIILGKQFLSGEGIKDMTEYFRTDFLKLPIAIYINAWNSLFMFTGIFTGILIAFIYLVLFLRWTTADIVKPVNELLTQMERTGKDRVNEYAIVRTNNEIGALTEGYNQMTARIRDYINNISKLNEAYSRFVPTQFLDILGKQNISDIQQGDQVEREMTVLFTDIRSFTELSESMTPKENFDFINRYLAYMEPVIGRNNGFIDKYIGDSIMALFTGGVEDSINAAIEMRIKLAEFNQVITQFGREPVDSGIGIHHGNLMLGVVGGEKRIDGTVISDAVNLASRLEGLTKVYGGSIIISEDTLVRINASDNYEYRFLDVVMVKGKKKAVYLFEILNGEPERCRELKGKTKYRFGKAADMYQNKEFESALKEFEAVVEENPKDIAARFYIKRCKRFIKEGVPGDWDGVERFRV